MITFTEKKAKTVTIEPQELARVVSEAILPPGEPADLAAPGHELTVTWDGVAGANDVEVDSALLTVHQDAIEETVPDLPLTGTTVTLPAGKHVASLKLKDFQNAAKLPIRNQGELAALGGDRRLVVAISQNGEPFGPPLYAVRGVPARGVFPATFTGAAFNGGVLTLPAVAAKKVQLSVVDNFPENGGGDAVTIGSVEGRLLTFPSNITLTDEEGSVVWAHPPEMAADANAAIDLRHAVENILKKKVKSGAPLTTTLKLQGTGRVRVAFSGARGAVLRKIDGVITTELAGDVLPLAIPEPPLPGLAPSRAIADVTVKYAGIRILDEVSDAVPKQAGGISGIVVGETAALRTLPPKGLDGFAVAKLGVVGRAAVDCELVVELVDAVTGVPLATPAAQLLAASPLVATIWLDVPPHEPVSVPAAISVRTNHGRFLWAASPHPLVRVAVFDPDPGGRPVRIDGRTVLAVTAPKEVHAPAVSIDAAAFASAAPLVDSSLFATVDLSDLRLEYDR